MKGIFLKFEEAESILQQLDEINCKIDQAYSKKDLEEWIDSRSVCKYLKISLRTLQKLRDEGRIPFSHPNKGLIRYRLRDIESFMDQNYVSISKEGYQ